MSLAQQRFLEGFIDRCKELEINDTGNIVALVKKSAKDALDVTKQVYKKMKKAPGGYPRCEDAKHGVHAYDEGKSTRYSTIT